MLYVKSNTSSLSTYVPNDHRMLCLKLSFLFEIHINSKDSLNAPGFKIEFTVSFILFLNVSLSFNRVKAQRIRVQNFHAGYLG